jgi:hypothetical protein
VVEEQINNRSNQNIREDSYANNNNNFSSPQQGQQANVNHTAQYKYADQIESFVKHSLSNF